MMIQFVMFIGVGFLLAWLLASVVRWLLSRTGWYVGRGPCLKNYIPSKDVLPLLVSSDAKVG